MNEVQRVVRERLSNLAIRQMKRDSERRRKSQRNRVLDAQRRGVLNRIEDCEMFLLGNQVIFRIDVNYGCSVVKMECGLELTYRPDGILSYESGRKRKAKVAAEAAEKVCEIYQENLFYTASDRISA